MRSVEVVVRDWKPQPLARVPTKTFQRWKQSLIDQLHVIDKTRSVHHSVDVRIKNMITFVESQCAAHVRAEGSMALIKAGAFFSFLVRLEQRQEGMKQLIPAGDPFIHQIDPVLRRRIKKGWELLTNVGGKFWPRVHLLQRQSRKKT